MSEDYSYEIISSVENDVISDSITQSWTLQAIECWQLDQHCSACSITQGDYSFCCKMPQVVKILLKNLGPPVGVNKHKNLKSA